MEFTKSLIKGKLIKRYKRFFVDVKLDNQVVTAHCPNTGSMKGLLDEGNEAYLLKNDDPKRKLKYTLQILKARRNLVGVNTHLANKIVHNGLIENLPTNCCVEVPVKIDSSGFVPQKIGKLPEHLSALMRTNVNVQILTAEAALTKKREHIYHAALLDPLTSSNLSIDEIYSMVDELIEAHGNYLPKYI